jgi:hypothetical protein
VVSIATILEVHTVSHLELIVYEIRTFVEADDTTKSFKHQTSAVWEDFQEKVCDLLQEGVEDVMLGYRIKTKDNKRSTPHVLRSRYDYQDAMEILIQMCSAAKSKPVEWTLVKTVRSQFHSYLSCKYLRTYRTILNLCQRHLKRIKHVERREHGRMTFHKTLTRLHPLCQELLH